MRAFIAEWQAQLYAASVGFVICWLLSFVSSMLTAVLSMLMILSSATVRAMLCATERPNNNPFTLGSDDSIGSLIDGVELGGVSQAGG